MLAQKPRAHRERRPRRQDVVDEEITDTWEAGFKARVWNDRVSLDGALYRTDVDGQHYFVFVGEVGAQVLVGIDEVRLMGGELAASIIRLSLVNATGSKPTVCSSPR